MAFTSALLIGGAALAAAGATAGAIGSSVNNRKAQEERSRMYNQSKNFLNAEYYRDPLSSVSNRALLKTMDQRLRDQNDALQNRAVAGGATMENQLAARKANNETMSNVYSNLLMGEDARRQQINQQKLQLEQQYSQGQQMSYLQNAQNWQAWGAQMAQAGMSLASSGLLNSGSLPKVTGVFPNSLPASVALRNNPITVNNGMGQVTGPTLGLVGWPNQ